MLRLVDLHHLTLPPQCTWPDWWLQSRKQIPPQVKRKGFDTLVVMICWLLWKERNARACLQLSFLACAGARQLDSSGSAAVALGRIECLVGVASVYLW
jgi:hypothetical protein